jgi:hypothetical protein
MSKTLTNNKYSTQLLFLLYNIHCDTATGSNTTPEENRTRLPVMYKYRKGNISNFLYMQTRWLSHLSVVS